MITEERIAHAKILTMLQDLAGISAGKNKKEKFTLTNQAYKWFFSRKSDFESWAIIGGFDPDYIREKAKKIYDFGMPEYKAKPGEGKRYFKLKIYKEKIRREKIRSQSSFGNQL